ncbi:sugar phosphate isomerase/epimerase family protein [Paenibacillus sp. FSL H8-0034]|uniref:sugar phosphate isomerase/epimerase family protein n=1 Tax=Paenibacillus sp. FSL H8-0034 TaxID=2954671 RepID=UPI0030F830F7
MAVQTRLTMLNTMAGPDFIQAMDQFALWGLEVIDLKDHIYGKSISDLNADEAEAAAVVLKERNLQVYSFSSELFYDDIEKGEEHFRTHHFNRITRLLQAADTLKPTMIRLLAAQYKHRNTYSFSMDYIHEFAPWLIPLYQEAVDRIHEAGYHVTIENECHDCIWATPSEIISFFHELNRPNKVHFTYDVQNLWQMGTYPSLTVYEALKPIIGFVHLKGGQQGEEGSSLVWKSSLEDASWPVEELVTQVVRDQISPVICLNPSHGKLKEGYVYDNLTKRDLCYVQALLGAQQ